MIGLCVGVPTDPWSGEDSGISTRVYERRNIVWTFENLASSWVPDYGTGPHNYGKGPHASLQYGIEGFKDGSIGRPLGPDSLGRPSTTNPVWLYEICINTLLLCMYICHMFCTFMRWFRY